MNSHTFVKCTLASLVGAALGCGPSYDGSDDGLSYAGAPSLAAVEVQALKSEPIKGMLIVMADSSARAEKAAVSLALDTTAGRVRVGRLEGLKRGESRTLTLPAYEGELLAVDVVDSAGAADGLSVAVLGPKLTATFQPESPSAGAKQLTLTPSAAIVCCTGYDVIVPIGCASYDDDECPSGTFAPACSPTCGD